MNEYVEYIGYFLGFIAALIIAYQDVKDREIHIAAFGLFFMGAISYAFFSGNDEFISNSLINLGLVAIILAILFLIWRIKGSPIRIDQQLGTGDLVMLVALCLWFSPEEFILFYAFSCAALSLMAILLLRIKKIDKDYPIPLAGGLAIFFMLLFPFKPFLLSGLSYGY